MRLGQRGPAESAAEHRRHHLRAEVDRGVTGEDQRHIAEGAHQRRQGGTDTGGTGLVVRLVGQHHDLIHSPGERAPGGHRGPGLGATDAESDELGAEVIRDPTSQRDGDGVVLADHGLGPAEVDAPIGGDDCFLGVPGPLVGDCNAHGRLLLVGSVNRFRAITRRWTSLVPS